MLIYIQHFQFSLYFFFYEIIKKLKKSQIIGLLFISGLLAVPALIYIITKDFFISFDKAQGLNVPLSKSD